MKTATFDSNRVDVDQNRARNVAIGESPGLLAYIEDQHFVVIFRQPFTVHQGTSRLVGAERQADG